MTMKMMKMNMLAAAVLVLVAAAAVCAGPAQAVKVVKYTVTSAGCTPNYQTTYANCTASWHCIDSAHGLIQGTAAYGLMFQGTIAASTGSTWLANVSWVAGDMTSGQMQWKYTDSTYTAVVAGSFQATSGSIHPLIATGFSSGAAINANPTEYCLWTDSSVAGTIVGFWENPAVNSETHCDIGGSNYGSYSTVVDSQGTLEVGVLSGKVYWSGKAWAGGWSATRSPSYPVGGIEVEKAQAGNAYGMYTVLDAQGRRTSGATYSMTLKSAATINGLDCLKYAMLPPPPTPVDDAPYYKGATAALAAFTAAMGLAVIILAAVTCRLTNCCHRRSQSGTTTTANPVRLEMA